MRLYQAGERSVGICEHCKAKVATHFEYRDYTPTGSDVTVPDVLLAMCERCGGVVGVPHQSTPKINEATRAPSPMEAVEARVPRAIEDIMALVSAALGARPKDIVPPLVRYYLGRVAAEPAVAEAVRILAAEPLASEPGEGRMSVKVSERHWLPAWERAKAAGIANKSQLLRGVALLAADDVQIQGWRRGVFIACKADRGAKARRLFLKALADTF